MKWWHWLILELLVMFGVMTWIFFFPCELWEEDAGKALLGFVLIFCIEKVRMYFRRNK